MRSARPRGARPANRDLKLTGELFHVQGMELDGLNVWVTSVDLKNHKGYIHEFDLATGSFLRRLELTDGVRYHPVGISIHGRSIWVPVAEPRRNSSAVLDEIDADSLQTRRKSTLRTIWDAWRRLAATS